jgi:predicted Zn-dependent peptidase
MMFRGSKRYPQFTQLAEAFEWLGGEWNAATGHEHTEYWYAGIDHNADEVIELFAEFLEHPQLNDIEIERAVIGRELDGELNDHGHSTDLEGHVAQLIWPGTTLAQPILGSHDTLAAITVDTLRTYRDRYYTPKNMAIYASGGDPERIPALLEKHFSTHRQHLRHIAETKFAPLPAYTGPAVRWVEHSDNEYELKLSFLCEGEWSDEVQDYELLVRILSDGFCSRLSLRLREELGLVYDIGAHTSLGIDSGTIDVFASCTVEQLDEFLRELFKLLRALRDEGPTERELERAVIRGVVDLELSMTAPEAFGPKLSWGALNDRRLALVDERDRLASATVERISSLCRRLLVPEKAALVALGPAAKDVEKRMRRALVEGLG